MLVLSRKRNESIMIGEDVRVLILEITGNKVRLGIAAPPEVMVHRYEVAPEAAILPGLRIGLRRNEADSLYVDIGGEG